MNTANRLLEIIDERIDNYMKKSNVICEYPAIVEKVISINYAEVKLAGYDIIFTVPIRTGLTVLPGDSVFIKCRINNFSNAIISDKFMRG